MGSALGLGLAALWDMDGVLVESAGFHYIAWKRAMAEIGVDISEDIFRRTFGQRNDTVIPDMLGHSVAPDAMHELADRKEIYYREAIKGSVEPLPGAMELLRALRAEGFRCAISSAAPRANVELILAELGAFPLFDALVANEDVTRGKPDPQVYLLAAERVRVSPSASLVLEDAVAGVAGAKAAGMACIAVTSTHSRQSLSRADLIVSSLKEVTPATVAGLIKRASAR